MQDIGATDTATLLQYTTNARPPAPEAPTPVWATARPSMNPAPCAPPRAPTACVVWPRRTTLAISSSPTFLGDNYNVDRIDIQRGPQTSILFGLGSPAGIVNASTRNAESNT